MANKQKLEEVFREAHEEQYKYVFVEVFVADGNYPASELIVNVQENILPKLEYYLNAYNDDLTLKTNPKIQILSFGAIDDLGDLEYKRHDESEVN